MQTQFPSNRSELFWGERRTPLAIGVALSLMLHTLAVPTLLWFDRRDERAQAFPVIEVSFTSDPQPARRQIVSPSEVASPPVTEVPSNLTRLSERDSVVEREQIKRGLPDAGPVVGDKPAARAPAPDAVQPNKRAALPPKSREDTKAPLSKSEQSAAAKQNAAIDPRVANLRLERDALVNAFGDARENRRQEQQQLAPNPQPFSRAMGSGAAFYGSFGSPDYLPSLPDGDMTMLNAKASKYATFVRRVAVQVFAALRAQGWDSLSGREINSASSSALARAVLSPQGELLRVELVERSGSNSFDRVVVSSIRTGARDPNPPAEARADDGTFRFVFEARSWAVQVANPRNGNPMERRWLMLGTGLE